MRIKNKDAENVASIICDAGGKLVGRTRLQKTACLLELADLGSGFHFDYYHYGPYSEELAQAATVASAMNLINEEERRSEWGGMYSIYTTQNQGTSEGLSERRANLIRAAAAADAITLELAATAAYLAQDGEDNPWEETRRRKPDKAEEGRLEDAKRLYHDLHAIAPSLPEI